jgi:fucose permease
MKDKTRTVDASELQNSYINLVAGDVVVAVCAFMYDLGDCEEEERQKNMTKGENLQDFILKIIHFTVSDKEKRLSTHF